MTHPVLGVALVLATAAAVGGCARTEQAPERERPLAPAPVPPAAQDLSASAPLFAWRCDDGTRLVSRLDADSRGLDLAGHDGTVRLLAERAASGARWAAGNESFHSKGDEALHERRDEISRCAVDPVATADVRAAADGAVFRALGNEPGWSVTLHPQRMAWVGAWGADRRSFVDVAVVDSEAGTVWRGRDDTGRLEVRIVAEPCRDDGDVAFPAQVRVDVDGEALSGCGRPLEAPF